MSGASRAPLSLVSVFKELLSNLVKEIANMIRRMVRCIPIFLIEYLGRFLEDDSLKTALQRSPIRTVQALGENNVAVWRRTKRFRQTPKGLSAPPDARAAS